MRTDVIRGVDELALVTGGGDLVRVRSGALVGRAQGCRVRFRDHRVSRHHAMVYLARGAWWIGDLGSTNGTFVDGAPVRGATPLREGSHVLVGGPGGTAFVVLRPVDGSALAASSAA
ncbi:FHA domain-containing protein [Nocardioides sp. ChNu-153]|nr:FHA domain-containing protein [Nocardioides sp. ChNu-153]